MSRGHQSSFTGLGRRECATARIFPQPGHACASGLQLSALTGHSPSTTPRLAELFGLPPHMLPHWPNAARDRCPRFDANDSFPGPEGRAFLGELGTIDGFGNLTMRGRRADRVVIDVAIECLPDGGWSLIAVDAAPLLHAEDTARRRATLLDGILHQVPHGIIVYGADMRILMMNEAYGQVMSGAPAAVRRVAGGRRPPSRGGRRIWPRHDRGARGGPNRPRHAKSTSASSPPAGWADGRDPHRTTAGRRLRQRRLRHLLPHRSSGRSFSRSRIARQYRQPYPARRQCLRAGPAAFASSTPRMTGSWRAPPISIGDTVEQVIEMRALAGEYGPGTAEAASQRQRAIDNTRPAIPPPPPPERHHDRRAHRAIARWRAHQRRHRCHTARRRRSRTRPQRRVDGRDAGEHSPRYRPLG